MLLFACAVVVILATASTSSARFAARTDSENNVWTAARLEIEARSAEQLFLDGAGLYPGLELENCISITYRGSVDKVDLRLHNQSTTGSLDQFFEISIEIGSGVQDDCSDFEPIGGPAFTGTLRGFSEQHDGFTSGLLLTNELVNEESIALRIRGTVADTNEAQGLDGRFVAVVEARP